MPATRYNIPRKLQHICEQAKGGTVGPRDGQGEGQMWKTGLGRDNKAILDFGPPGSHNFSLFCWAPALLLFQLCPCSCTSLVPQISVPGRRRSLDAARLTSGLDKADVRLQLRLIPTLPGIPTKRGAGGWRQKKARRRPPLGLQAGTYFSPGRISELSPGSCFPNWLQGKPSTTRPTGISSS